MKLLHLGIPTEQKIEGKTYTYVERIKLHVTNPDEHAYKLQFICAEPDSPLPEIVKTQRHLSIRVADIDEEIALFDEKTLAFEDAYQTVNYYTQHHRVYSLL